jgi:hypothetical protein
VVVGHIVTGNLHGSTVELDVRTRGDGLGERRLRQRRIGMRLEASTCTDSVAHACAVDLGLAAGNLCIHVEAAPRILGRAGTIEGHARVFDLGVADDVVDLIEVEDIAAAIQGLVHHFRHHQGIVDVNAVQIDHGAAQAGGLQIEIDVNTDIDLVVDGVFDLVVDAVVELVVGGVVGLVAELVVETVLVVVAVLVVISVSVVVLFLIFI